MTTYRCELLIVSARGTAGGARASSEASYEPPLGVPVSFSADMYEYGVENMALSLGQEGEDENTGRQTSADWLCAWCVRLQPASTTVGSTARGSLPDRCAGRCTATCLGCLLVNVPAADDRRWTINRPRDISWN